MPGLGSGFVFRSNVDPRVGPARRVVRDGQTSFAGGLNTISADDAVGPNQFRRGDNGRLTAYGAVTKRGGTQRTAAALSTGNAIQNGVTWFKGDGTTLVAAVANGTLFTTTYGTFPVTWTQRGSTGALSSTVTPSFANFLQSGGTESLYIADGGLLNRLVGTTLTTNIASTASCNVIAVHNQRLWGVGDSTSPQGVFYSALNDGDSLGNVSSSGGVIIVRTFGNQNAVGLLSLGTSLLVFHARGVSRITGYGQSDVTASPAAISGDVGTIAPRSPCRVDWTAYFVSERGLYMATEAEVMPVATPEQPDPLIAILPTMSATDIAKITTVLNRATRELWITVPTFGVYVYHTVLRAWAGPWNDGYVSPDSTAMWETVNASNYPIIWRGDSSGFVSECDSATCLDNIVADGTGGTAFTLTLQCKRFFAGDPLSANAWRWGYVLADLAGSQNASLSYATDTDSGTIALPPSTSSTWGASATTWGTGEWGSVSQTSYRIPLSGNGYLIDLTVTDSGQAPSVYSQVRVEGFQLGRR